MKDTLPEIVPTLRSSVTNVAKWDTWLETVPKNLTTNLCLDIENGLLLKMYKKKRNVHCDC